MEEKLNKDGSVDKRFKKKEPQLKMIISEPKTMTEALEPEETVVEDVVEDIVAESAQPETAQMSDEDFEAEVRRRVSVGDSKNPKNRNPDPANPSGKAIKWTHIDTGGQQIK